MAIQNVVDPNANSPVPSGQAPGAVQQLLAGMNAPIPQAPAPPPPTPVQQNTSKWAGIVQAAFNGLQGGLKAGLQNIQDAGTPRGPHANGVAEGEAEQQNFLAQQQQKQLQQNAQSQQDWQNQMEMNRANQEAILNRARMAESNLNALKLAMSIDQAPQDKQDAYYNEQNAHVADLRKEGMSQLAVMPDLNSLGQWMKENGKTAMDVVPIHVKNAQGQDEIHVFENPDHQVDAATINRGLQAYGAPTVPDGSSMDYAHYKSMLGQAQSKYADELSARQLEEQREKFEHGENVYKESQENARAALAHKNEQDSAAYQNQLEAAVDQIHNGKLTFSQATKGMGKEAAQFARDINYRMTQKYPDDNLEALQAYSKYAEHPQTQNQLNQARTLFGSNGQKGTFDLIQDLVNQVPSGPNIITKYAQPAQYAMGQQALSQLRRLLPEVANDLSQFQTGAGGRQTDARVDNALSQLQTADTRDNLEKGYRLLRTAAEERLHGIVGENPYLRQMSKDINPPTMNEPAPANRIVQRNKVTGAMRHSDDGGKTWSIQ